MRDLRDMFVIARREFLERVKSKLFVAVTLLGPIGMVALVLVPALLSRGAEGTKVEIVDKTGVLAQPLSASLAAVKWKPVVVPASTSEQAEMDRIRDNQINGFLTIPADGIDGGAILYRGDNGSSQSVQSMLHVLVGQAVQAERGKRLGIAPDKIAALIAAPNIDSQQTNGETASSSGLATFFIGYLIAYIVFLVITLYAVNVMRSVVQEKTSRVMELMVATVKPRSLMTGKIIGVGGAGFVQITAWLTMGAITLAYRDQILGALGAPGGGASLPSLTFDQLAISVLYYIFGFFFYASMYAAVGAMVSSEQDTQQVQMPITILLVIGIMCVTMVSNDPRGSTASIMTMVPFWSAVLMPMRYLLGGASLGEVVISLAILAVSTVLITRAAAKIYRVGVLMYGKRPSVGELIRWLRY